ncbi:MAG: WxcM-like domain-containing protein [Dehalococcoidia bacterium]|nr:WxcM-like domain-containing protein [Dehalococcoidia bacterium]
MEAIGTEAAKKVPTYDAAGNENGYLIELYKDGDRTLAYLTAAKPGAFKGYHLHRVRAARYVCVRGRMRIILYAQGQRREYVLDAATPQRLTIPPNVATGLENLGDEEAWLINYPDPPYDPSLQDEQVEYTEAELEAGVLKA